MRMKMTFHHYLIFYDYDYVGLKFVNEKYSWMFYLKKTMCLELTLFNIPKEK